MGRHGIEHPPDVDAALDRLVPRLDLGPIRWRHPDVAREIYRPSVEQALGATRPGQRVLDAGSGLGSVARALALAGREVVAIDGDADACTGARRTLSGTDGQVVQAWFGPDDGLALGSFDVIRFGRVLHHVVDLAAALDHALELLIDDGSVIVEEFAPECIDRCLADWLIMQAAALEAAGEVLDDPPSDAAAFLDDWQVKIARMQLISAATVRSALDERFALGDVYWQGGIWADIAKRVVAPDRAGVIAHRMAEAEDGAVRAGQLPGVVMRLVGHRHD